MHSLENLNKMSENSLPSFSSKLRSGTLSSPGMAGVRDRFPLSALGRARAPRRASAFGSRGIWGSFLSPREVGSPSKACRRPRREDLPVVCGAETRGNPARSVASGAPRARGSLRLVGSPSKACRRPRREDLPVVCGAETRGNPARSVASGAPRARGSLRLVEVPCKARCRPPTEEDPSCPVTSAGARQSRRKCGPGCAPRPRTAQDGGISEQSLPSPKKRRPSCRLWSGDARESRKKRGFGCAPCPWVAEAGGRAVQSSLPPTDRRRPFVSRDERRCEAVAAEVWPGMRTTPSDGPGRSVFGF
nr:uncharacterized protein LOC102150068 isoform X5 [Equus caballus]